MNTLKLFANQTYPFKLPQLPFADDQLEPEMSQEVVQIHYEKHHAAYVKNLNTILENYPQLKNLTLSDLLMNSSQLPDEIRQGVINQAGGHANHTLFWETLGQSDENTHQPLSNLQENLNQAFGSFTQFQDKFNKEASTFFGSGWTWLIVDQNKRLQIESTVNQNSPLIENRIPLLGIDLWEHAYYLQYQNRRADYINSWWNLVNWQKVNDLFCEIIGER